MRLPFHIIQLLKAKSGNDLRLPSDCEFLSLDIQSKTGVRIGATTLKRLLTLSAYYERQTNKPLLSSSSYPTTTHDFGLSMKFSLTR
jgi:hypothetical protein